MVRRIIAALAIAAAMPAAAQENGLVSSTCLAMAQGIAPTMAVSYRVAQAGADTVRLTFAGHSTYRIQTPGGVSIATDFSGVFGGNPPPRVATMNKAHSTHYTERPDPAIEHVLKGWGDGAPASHALVVDDVLIRNVTTDIRRWGASEPDANSIFIFEVAGLCIGHLGHLHHELTNRHYAAIGRLDVVMVPVDGGLTASIATMEAITRRLHSSVVLPMHRNATALDALTSRLGDSFDIRWLDGDTLDLSLRTLPDRPTIFIPRNL